MTPELSFKLARLPDAPGCYLMKSGGEIIYVGKAKNLKNRVRQYFHAPSGHTPKVRAMVEKIDDFDTVLVDNELEALILECNLIKRHQPFYNILLKDDKHYPYVAIDMNEEFPRIQLRRKVEPDGCRYFGPFKSATTLRETLDVLRIVFPVRACDKKLNPQKKLRPCVHHAVGQCLAPCAGLVDRETYMNEVRGVISFLSGHFEPILKTLNERMLDAAAAYQYERAAVCRDRIRAVEAAAQKQKAIAPRGGDCDVLAVRAEGDDALVERMTVRGGKLDGARHYALEHTAEESAAEILTSFILQHYDAKDAIPGELLLAEAPADAETVEALLSEVRGARVHIVVPKRGEKKQLVDMVEKNLRDEYAKRAEKLARSAARTTGAAAELGRLLGLPKPPRRIEGYDISNTQGAQSVGSMVVMIDGVCVNKAYRHFRIKTVEGANDFASMHEVLLRRFTHGLEEYQERAEQGLDPAGGKFSDLPDLVLIDGGAGQLGAALDAMREAGADVPMFGLAKRIEEIVLPGGGETLLLDRHSDALHLIQRLRDEAHRFGITHHRKLRAQQSVGSALDGIPGIGKTKKRALLARFRTIEEIKEASIETLCEAEGVGEVLARTIRTHFHPEERA